MEPETPGPPRPSRLRRWRRRLLRALLALIAALLLYLLAAWLGALIQVNTDRQPPTQGIEIAIWSNGVHTDLILPRRHALMDWDAFAPLERPDPNSAGAPYLMFGWGDRGFYLDVPTWDDLSVGVVAEALIWPSRTVMHVQRLGFLPAESATCARLRLRPEEYRRLLAFVKAGFAQAENKPVLIPGAAYGAEDVFYEAVGRYHLLYTCNNWLNGALSAAGLRAALWSPMTWGVMKAAKSR